MKHNTLGSKEKKLLVWLRKNNRRPISELALRNNFPISTMFDVLGRMEQRNIVEHKSRVCFEKIGFPVKIFTVVKTELAARPALRKYLAQSKNVNSLHFVDSGFDFHIETVFSNQKEASDFFEDMRKRNTIVSECSYSVIETIQTEKFLTEEAHFEN